MLLPGQTILEYYRRIDSGDLDWVMSLFAGEAIYHRADKSYVGRGEIERFFREQRKIAGTHTVEAIWSLANDVVCRGRFEGVGAAGDERRVGFADFWTFNADGLVVERRSYLALGYQYVEA